MCVCVCVCLTGRLSWLYSKSGYFSASVYNMFGPKRIAVAQEICCGTQDVIILASGRRIYAGTIQLFGVWGCAIKAE